MRARLPVDIWREREPKGSGGAWVAEAKVVITDLVDDDLALEREVLAGVARVEALGAKDEAELVGRVEDADAIMVYAMRLSRATIARLERCRLIVRCGVGYDKIDGAFARERGIPLAHVPDYCTEEVADTALAQILALTRGLTYQASRLQAAAAPWSWREASSLSLRRLRGRVLGVVGLGRIGTATALRARALGLEVAYYDPYKPHGFDKALGLRRVNTLEDLARDSEILSLHCPLTPETRGMIDARVLSLLPAGAYLVNTARGAVVDTSAIPAAVESGRLAGVALDVLEHEPPADDDPLIRAWRDPQHPAHWRVVLTPHSAFYSRESRRESRTLAADTVRRALAGEPVATIVN
jgi:D-3-phosphoglycerate dehydrogenase/C-terminal binding protein